MEGDRSWVIEETGMEWWWRRLIRERWREWVGRFSSSHRSASKTERRGANAMGELKRPHSTRRVQGGQLEGRTDSVSERRRAAGGKA